MRKKEVKKAGDRVYVVEYGFRKIGEQKPYFSMTGEEWETKVYERHLAGSQRAEPYSCGCLHDMIAKQFPKLAELIQFHLWDFDGVPMHFQGNGEYWHHMASGRAKFRPYYRPEEDTEEKGSRVFLDHVAYGRLPEDATDAESVQRLLNLDAISIGPWLQDRLPKLQTLFKAAMEKHDIKWEER